MLSALKMTCTCPHRRQRCHRARAALTGISLLLLGLGATPALGAPAPEGTITLGEGIRGPDITIIEREEQTVFEFRQNGQLRMVRVVPKWGKPYYLVPRDQTTGFGDLERADMLLPSWVIAEF